MRNDLKSQIAKWQQILTDENLKPLLGFLTRLRDRFGTLNFFAIIGKFATFELAWAMNDVIKWENMRLVKVLNWAPSRSLNKAFYMLLVRRAANKFKQGRKEGDPLEGLIATEIFELIQWAEIGQGYVFQLMWKYINAMNQLNVAF